MASCYVRWRPSGGRGEYEFVPGTALANKEIRLRIPELSLEIETDVAGTISQGKPRLRKHHPNDRSRLHLVPLVMAAARLPDPAREDKLHSVQWPLENKAFIVSQMDFDIVGGSSSTAVLRPLRVHILHSTQTIDLKERFAAIAEDIKEAPAIKGDSATLGKLIEDHIAALKAGPKSGEAVRARATQIVDVQASIYGATNAAAVSTIKALPPTPLEDDISGKEGRILTRLHSYKERDRKLVKDAKAAFKAKHGTLWCECCKKDPKAVYGPRGEGRVQAHHLTPVEELLPDSVTTAKDLAMVCPNCHDIIHAKRPWLTPKEVRDLLAANGT